MNDEMIAKHIVIIVHYFPPLNSAGGKRFEAMAKYFTQMDRRVTVLTTVKSASDGDFTESLPTGVEVIYLDGLGRVATLPVSSQHSQISAKSIEQGRGLKDVVMRIFGQLPDPRLPFAFGLLSPGLATDARRALVQAEVVVGSTPPWPILLAALFAGWRFKKPVVLDYRDHFSFCHEMPGSRLAKRAEYWLDRILARRASEVVTISEPMAGYYSRFNRRTSVVSNGYDPDIISEARSRAQWRPRNAGDPVIVRYLGVITPGRVPYRLFSALDAAISRNAISSDAVRFEIFGEAGVLKDALQESFPALRRLFSYHPRVPYLKSIELATTADYLLFCETPRIAPEREKASALGVLTTKLFEYLAVGRPIIAEIDRETLAGRLIRKAGCHHFVTERQDEFGRMLTTLDFLNPPVSIDNPFVQTLSRASQAKDYLDKLDMVVARNKST